jgi:hypothetical protein
MTGGEGEKKKVQGRVRDLASAGERERMGGREEKEGRKGGKVRWEWRPAGGGKVKFFEKKKKKSKKKKKNFEFSNVANVPR